MVVVLFFRFLLFHIIKKRTFVALKYLIVSARDVMFRVVITKKSNNYEKDYDDFGYSLCSRMCERSGVYRRRFQPC